MPLPPQFQKSTKPESEWQPCSKCGTLHPRKHTWCGPCYLEHVKKRKAEKAEAKQAAKEAAQHAANKNVLKAKEKQAAKAQENIHEFVLYTDRNTPYKPNPLQLEFHQSEQIFRCLIGGKRGGKSLACCAEIIDTAIQYPGIDILVAMKHRSNMYGGTWLMIQRMLKYSCPELIFDQRREPLEIRLVNGSTIHGRGLADTDVIGSKAYGAIFVEEVSNFTDEEMEELYPDLVARLSTLEGPNRMWLCGYSRYGSWYWQRFFIDPDENHFGLTLDARDNAKHLPSNHFKIARSTMSAEQWRQYVEGEFLEDTGTIFWMFDMGTHVIEPFEIPTGWKRYIGLDPGWGDNAAVVWLAVDEEGNHFCYDLFCEKHLTISEICAEIKRRSGHDKIEWIAIDPKAATQTSDQTGENRVSSYIRHLDGYDVILPPKPNTAKEDDIALIQELLQFQREDADTPSPAPPHPSTSPQLFFFDGLKPLIHEVRYWRRDPKTNKPKDRKDDCVSALRYVLSTCPVATSRPPRDFVLPQTEELMGRWMTDKLNALAQEPTEEPHWDLGSMGIAWIGNY